MDIKLLYAVHQAGDNYTARLEDVKNLPAENVTAENATAARQLAHSLYVAEIMAIQNDDIVDRVAEVVMKALAKILEEASTLILETASETVNMEGESDDL